MIKHTFVVMAYKESKYLEECIKSVNKQTYKSEVVIATSTPNEYIKTIAKKYKLKTFINKGKTGIGYDFDFAISCVKDGLITVAHQDDIYDENYSESIVNKYSKDSLILFTDYYEIKNNKKIYSNMNLKIKRLLLLPMRLKNERKSRLMKRSIISFGNAICCPAVTFNRNKITLPVFSCNMKCDIDWYAWERLSNKKGSFVFVNQKLMGHRIHDDSTTTDILKDNGRINEDYLMFCKFWPKAIAKVFTKFYQDSEKNNKVRR